MIANMHNSERRYSSTRLVSEQQELHCPLPHMLRPNCCTIACQVASI